MVENRINPQVKLAGTLEEVRQIVCSAEQENAKSRLLRKFVFIRSTVANCFLSVLKFILFRKLGNPRKEFLDIVVYAVGILGDNVVILPALASLRKRFPLAKITLISSCQNWDPRAAIELLEPSPFLDDLIILRDYDCPVQRHRFRFVLAVPELKNIPCDLFVNLSPFGNRGWLGAVVREMVFGKVIGAKQAIGFRVSTYNHHGAFNAVQHHFVKNEPRRFRQVLEEIGITQSLTGDFLPRSPTAKANVIARIAACGRIGKPIVVLNPGAKFDVQCWPAHSFGVVARLIAEKHQASILLTGIETRKATSTRGR